VLYPLDGGFAAVVDKEVDGEGSLPAQIEINPSRRISQVHAATRAARAVFLCSAPLVGRPNAGLSDAGLRLACVEPGDQLAIFGEALRELKLRATYLYEEAGRYWFSTQPNMNREADDRAKSLPEHAVDEAISRVLNDDARAKGGFDRVFAAPDDVTQIDEVSALSVVVLGPSTPHSGRAATPSTATAAVSDALTRCRSSQRRCRNTLIFVAADEGLLATAREAMRRAMAWADISGDERLQKQLTQSQAAAAKDSARTSNEGAMRAVRNAWNHILFPVKTDATEAGKAFELEHLTLSAKDKGAIPAGVYEKARADGVVLEKLGPDTLWLKLRPLWAEDRPHTGSGPTTTTTTSAGPTSVTLPPPAPTKPHRFYGSVEIDINRPVKAFDTILNSVVMELQRSPGAKVKLTLEIEAESPSGFNEQDVGVVRDNTKQLKFTPGSTGFAE
jgi:hypothetical protein